MHVEKLSWKNIINAKLLFEMSMWFITIRPIHLFTSPYI